MNFGSKDHIEISRINAIIQNKCEKNLDELLIQYPLFNNKIEIFQKYPNPIPNFYDDVRLKQEYQKKIHQIKTQEEQQRQSRIKQQKEYEKQLQNLQKSQQQTSNDSSKIKNDGYFFKYEQSLNRNDSQEIIKLINIHIIVIRWFKILNVKIKRKRLTTFNFSVQIKFKSFKLIKEITILTIQGTIWPTQELKCSYRSQKIQNWLDEKFSIAIKILIGSKC
ncbi:unnamed protein product [Paramecium primaurelia]|uniref:Uncharacterized protein n=1 Tax=Paramecium primaurelia TaxID=5886 RepID=A0A8S1LG37_PARPR|nr:unnamed protein product [Paramecium primaurelia]